MKILQINSTVNSGSTGRIAEDIGRVLIKSGHESYIAAAYTNRPSQSKVITIGNKFDRFFHGLKTRFFDLHGFGSRYATKKFVAEIQNINPDVIHLHNVHGYYLNIEVFFQFLAKTKTPVVWTHHDCWAFTGHCSFFDSVGCEKWKTGCFACPKKQYYPASWIVDNSKNNYLVKQRLFNLPDNITKVAPSAWLKDLIELSFLKKPVKVINNGIDLDVFKPAESSADIRRKYGLGDKKIVLGVANIWDKRKGLADFVRLSELLSPEFQIFLVGVGHEHKKHLPRNIVSISRTEDIHALARLYSSADCFVNPTYQDNFPTTNLEALACGTPVVTYKTGGSPESVDENCGMIVDKGDIIGLKKAVENITLVEKLQLRNACRNKALKHYNKKDRFHDYQTLYESLLKSNL
jgi:glycosyltransferase involved in cell wall biosynthesis